MSDNLRDRIAEVIEETICGHWEEGYGLTVADAVMRIVNLHIPPILASAIHAYADEELVALRFQGGGTAVEQVEDLHRNAAQIAQYATTHAKWAGRRPRSAEKLRLTEDVAADE